MKHRNTVRKDTLPHCIDNDPQWAEWNITRAEKQRRESEIQRDWAEELSADHQYALDCIRAAYTLRTKEARLRMFEPQRTDKSYAIETEGEERLQMRYTAWWQRCAGRGWNMTLLHGLIVEQMTPREKVAPVLGNIAKALDEYLRIK